MRICLPCREATVTLDASRVPFPPGKPQPGHVRGCCRGHDARLRRASKPGWRHPQLVRCAALLLSSRLLLRPGGHM